MPNLWNVSDLQPGPESLIPGDTLPAMFWNAVARRGDQVWMRQKEFGVWRSWTWNQTAQAVREIAHGLMALGFERGNTASIQSNTVIEWVLADLAVLSCGGVIGGKRSGDGIGLAQCVGHVIAARDDELAGRQQACLETAGGC